MTNCNFCNKRETRSCKFDDPYVCNSCKDNQENYADNRDGITFIDSGGNRIEINSDTDFDIIHENDKIIDTVNSYKDSLLASLYSQVDFLRNQIEEKDLQIRSLLVNDYDMHKSRSNRRDLWSDDSNSTKSRKSGSTPVHSE